MAECQRRLGTGSPAADPGFDCDWKREREQEEEPTIDLPVGPCGRPKRTIANWRVLIAFCAVMERSLCFGVVVAAARWKVAAGRWGVVRPCPCPQQNR